MRSVIHLPFALARSMSLRSMMRSGKSEKSEKSDLMDIEDRWLTVLNWNLYIWSVSWKKNGNQLLPACRANPPSCVGVAGWEPNALPVDSCQGWFRHGFEMLEMLWEFDLWKCFLSDAAMPQLPTIQLPQLREHFWDLWRSADAGAAEFVGIELPWSQYLAGFRHYERYLASINSKNFSLHATLVVPSACFFMNVLKLFLLLLSI